MVTRAYLGDGMFEELKPSANAADVQRCRNEWACTAKRFVCKRAREGEPDVAVDQARLKGTRRTSGPSLWTKFFGS